MARFMTDASQITSTRAAAKRARGVHGNRPADIPEPPVATKTPSSDRYLMQPDKKQDDPVAPQITPKPGSTDWDRTQGLQKRQGLALTTITRTVAIVTLSNIVTRTVTSTTGARATTTVSITNWQTVTSVINAKRTTTETTTVFVTPNVPSTVRITVNGGSVTEVVTNLVSTGSSTSTTGLGGDNPNQNSNPVPQSGSGGLSKGAQIGIGAGVSGGSLVICLILGFFFVRRRKSRKEKNQEMIQDAVNSAMAAQQSQQAQQTHHNIPPVSYYDKHMSTSTYSAPSPHPTSPSPPIHAPQPSYVYPPPPGHYNTDPMNFAEAMGSQPRSNGAMPLYGTEIGGTPVQRHELPQFSSPPPGHVVPCSDLPMVRR